MTKAEKLAALRNWQTVHEDLKNEFDVLEPIIGLCGEKSLGAAVWSVFEQYTDILADLLGDDSGWLNWYCYENDMGAKGYEAGYGENLRPIENLDDLLWLIEEGTKNDSAETLV